MMKGTIGIESELGKGSTFWFRLPAKRKQVYLETNRYFRADANNVRVLLVGHDEAYQEILARQLNAWGFSSDKVSDLSYITPALEGGRMQNRPFTALLITNEKVRGLIDYLRSLPESQGQKGSVPIAILVANAMSSEDGKILSEKNIRQIVRPMKQSSLFDCIISLTNDDSVRVAEKMARKQSESGKVSTFDAKILLAEDNEINQLIAHEFIKAHGIIPTIVENGKLALDAAVSQKFDLILLDCHMPEMDGFEAAKGIRDHELKNGLTRIPLIALTADVTVETQDRCKEVGMDFYLSKPLDPSKLADMLDRFLRTHKESSPVVQHGQTILAAPIDLDALNLQFQASPQIVETILYRFKSQLELDFASILGFQRSGETEKVLRTLRVLKGAAATVGANSIYEATGKLEELFKSNELSGRSQQLEFLKAEMTRCLEFLKY